MRISDLFRQQSLQPSKSGETDSVIRRTEEEAQGLGRNQEDTVNISALSRQLNSISQILREDEERSSVRVAELKEQVQAGTYSVSSEDVARSIVSFARDQEI